MNENQKLAATAVAFVACTTIAVYTHVKMARSTKRINKLNDKIAFENHVS